MDALNQADYDTCARLCDPHMTSFEPENLGHLVDNLDYRRFCADQAQRQRQLQLALSQNHSFAASASVQQVAASAAAMAAANALAAKPQASVSQQQQLQQVAMAAASAALAQLNLAATSGGLTSSATAGSGGASQVAQLSSAATASRASQSASLSALRQYSLLLNPSVQLLGEDAASIAYTKLSQVLEASSGRLHVEQSEETRVWHRKDGSRWLCVHLHRSLPQGSHLGLDKLSRPDRTPRDH